MVGNVAGGIALWRLFRGRLERRNPEHSLKGCKDLEQGRETVATDLKLAIFLGGDSRVWRCSRNSNRVWPKKFANR